VFGPDAIRRARLVAIVRHVEKEQRHSPFLAHAA
jgi:hypothetical protein